MRKPRKASLDAPRFTTAANSVWDEYQQFLARTQAPGGAEAKAFAGRHAAARSALGHLEHLLKLASEQGQAKAVDNIRRLTQAARQEIAALPPEEPSDDDGA